MATIRQRGESWTLDWYDETGERRQISLGKIPEREAKTILKAKEAELATGIKLLTGGPSAAPYFGDFAVTYKKWHALEYPSSHERVAQIIDDHLIPTFQFKQLDAIKVPDAEEWKQKRLSARASVGTVTKELRTLKAIVNKAIEWEKISRNPIQSVSPPQQLVSKPFNFYTQDQLRELYRWSGIRQHVWKLLANTGLRRAEGLNLPWAQVDGNHVNIFSNDSGARTKSGKWRAVPLSPGAKEALTALRLLSDEEYVLPRMQPESMSRLFIQHASRASVGGSMHDLRHTFISHLVMKGVPLRTVQVLAGHSTIAVTEQYAHLAPGHMHKSVEDLDL